MTGYTQEVSYDYTNQSYGGTGQAPTVGRVRDCKHRSSGMVVEIWCNLNNISIANYCYRIMRVRKACLDQIQTEQSNFIELPIPSEENTAVDTENVSDPIPAIRIKTKEGVSFEVFSNASTEVLKYLIKVITHAE